MGYLRSLFTGAANPVLDAALMDSTAELGGLVATPSFAVDSESIPPTVVGIETYGDGTGLAPRIPRSRAMQVPAVKRSRDLICATLGGLPLELFGPDKRTQPCALFEQPERNRPRSATMIDVFEDMLFEKYAWWRVSERNATGWPVYVDHIKPSRVNVNDDTKQVFIDGTHVPDADLIRFHGPTDALLIAGARAIRTCLLLDTAAANMANGVPPSDWFTPAEGADPADDDVIEEILEDWAEARRRRSTAYVPAALKYNRDGLTAEEMQLHDSRQHAVLEVARVAGIDSEDLGVSTTSRTYFNAFDRKQHRVQNTLTPFITAAQDTLSMRNVTPRGYTASLNIDSLLRSDPKERYEAYAAGLAVGAITPERIAQIEGVPAENVRALPAPVAEPKEIERAS